MTIEAYYRERASEYDAFYQIREHSTDLARLRAWLVRCARGRTILEVAAGTGYWTKVAASVAKAVTATDYNHEVLAIAARRHLGARATLLVADAYALPDFRARFDVGMAHLWWSHVPKQRQQEFLSHFASRLQPRAALLMIDQVYVKGFSHPMLRRDRHGDRYELRVLGNGETHQIVKNYPEIEELQQSLAKVCDEIRITRLRYFWALSARIRARRR
jgi:ubiquinone/menaquinone biosynthesis C-methylase UbiE